MEREDNERKATKTKMNHELDDEPMVYLVVRRSPDCSPKMVEIMGSCLTLERADYLRSYLFTKDGTRCEIQGLHTEKED